MKPARITKRQLLDEVAILRKKLAVVEDQLDWNRRLMENDRTGSWYEDLQNQKAWFSSSWRAMMGYEDEVISPNLNRWKHWVHPNDRARVQRALREVFGGGRTTFDCKYRLQHRNGLYRCIHSFGRLVHDRNAGRATVFIGSDIDITEKERHDQFITQMLDTIPSLLFIKDNHGRFRYANKALTEAFGTAVDEIIGKTDADFNDNEEQVKRFRAADNRVLRTRRPVRIREEQLDFADGSQHILATIKVPVPMSTGQDPKAVEVFGVATDITQLKQEVAQSRELFKNLMDHVPVVVFFKDENSRFIRANRELAKLVGADSPEDLEHKTDFDFFPREQAASWRKEEKEIFRTGIPVLDSLRYTQPQRGKATWRLVTKIPIMDKRTGRVLRIVGISRDFTERKREQDELDQKNKLLQQIFDNVPECIWLKDTRSRYVECNKSFLQRYGYTDKSQVLGKTDLQRWEEMVGKMNPERRKAFREQAQHYFEDDQEVIRKKVPRKLYEEVQRMADGKVRYLVTSKIPLLDEQGNVTALLGIYRDTTTEESLRLHSQVTARISQSFGNWVQVLENHTARLGRLHGIGDKDAFQKLNETVQTLCEATHTATNFAELPDIEFEEIRLNEMVRSIVSECRDARMRFRTGSDEAICEGSETHLRNAVLELLRNARDFAPPGKRGRISIWIEESRKQCSVHVKDNGPGVNEWLRPDLFAIRPKRGEENRTGMGLAYVAAVMQQHSGAVRLHGSGIAGAHFVIRLPRHRASISS